ncbi:MAG: hypothetical protein WC942_07415 [Clostridia bacterium]|jgi:hypothetical protein
MSEARHKAQTISDGLHAAISFEFANAAERLSAGPFENYDIYKLAIQFDNESIYILTQIEPPNWHLVTMTSSSSSSGIFGPDNTTNKAIAVWDGTDGYYLKNSVGIITDDGYLQGVKILLDSLYDISNGIPLDGYFLKAYDGYWKASQLSTDIINIISDNIDNIVGEPVDVGLDNHEGSSVLLSRADHVHKGSVVKTSELYLSSDVSTTSTEFITLMSKDIETGDGYLFINFTVCGENNSPNRTVAFRILVDGTNSGCRGCGFTSSSASSPVSACTQMRVNVLSGSHTIEVYWRVSAGTGSILPITKPEMHHASVIITETAF